MKNDLTKTKEELVAELENLRFKNKEHLETLRSSEQQQRAANQQLKANNQQLRASEEQLRAANQQLEANNQQLIAAEKELQKQHDFLQKVIDAVPNRIFWKDQNSVYLGCNISFVKDCGKNSHEEVVGQTDDVMVWKENADVYRANDRQVMLNGVPKLNYEEPFKNKNGEQIVWRTSKVPLKNDKGEVVGILATSEDITQRKKAENALRESQEKYMALYKNAPLPYQSLNEDGRFRDVNPAWLSSLGYDREAVIGKNYSDFLHPDYKEHFKKNFAAFKKRGYVKDVQFKILHQNGQFRDISFEGCIGYNPDGSFKQTYCVFQDITEQKLARVQLLKLSTAIQQSPSVISITDIKGNLEYVNPKFTALTGYSSEEVIGQNPRILKSDKKAPEFYKNLWATISSGKVWNGEFHNKKKNGELYWEMASVSPILDEQGKIINYLKVANDITEQKLITEALVENEAKFRTLFNRVQDAVFIFNMETFKLVEANQATSKIYGYERDELIGMSVMNLSADVEKSKLAAKTVIEKGEVDIKLIQHKKKDGSIIYMQLQGYKTVVDKMPVIFAVCHNITEAVQAEQDLKLALEKAQESDRLKSAFLANMSHEIRTPMNGILGFTELLKEPRLTGDERDEFIDVIEKSGHRMLNTINDIIDISKIEAGQVKVIKSEVSVNHILQEQFYFFSREAQSKGLELQYTPTLSDSQARIVTDQHKLEGILTNLIKNAIKYTEKGNIRFGCTLKNEADNNVLKFFVTDTGIGIPQNRLEAIFNRFEQADIEDTRVFQGSGLGLAISKSYVEMLGGSIRVESNEGFGCTFSFTIPYIQQQIKDTSTYANLKKVTPALFHNLSVIIAEDDEISTLFFENVFTNLFHKITFASNGEETVRLCRENPDTDIILMDIKMPGMNGYEATREIRKFNNDVVIIAQTAFGLSGDWEKAIKAGCNDYIAKPINKEELFEKIYAALDQQKSD